MYGTRYFVYCGVWHVVRGMVRGIECGKGHGIECGMVCGTWRHCCSSCVVITNML